jgi:hypothetical protein
MRSVFCVGHRPSGGSLTVLLARRHLQSAVLQWSRLAGSAVHVALLLSRVC